MRLAILVAAALWASTTSAAGLWNTSSYRPGQVRCSSLPAISATPVSATTSDNLATKLSEACGSGAGILELAAGTYTDTNLMLGSGGGVSIGGECEIRAANPASKPLLRAAIGTSRAVIQVRNVTHRIRLTDLVIDGRRADQTDASMSAICADTTPADGICDGSGQNTAAVMGIDSRITSSGNASTCALRIDVIETVGDAFFLRDQIRSAVEDSTVDGAGCDTTTCPTLTVPADRVLNSITVNGRGVNWVDSDDVMAVDVTVTDVTKQGIQCYDSANCYGIGNTVTGAGSTGLTMLASSGGMLGNAVDGVGTNWAQNSTTVANGEGMLFTDGGLPRVFQAFARSNTFANLWGDGIRAGLQAGTPPEPTVKVEGNTVTTVCTGSTSTTNAGLSLGDNIDPFERLEARNNIVTGSSCATAIRVRNLPVYTGSGNTVGTTTSGDGVTYTASAIAESSLTTDADVEIDASTTGTLSGCTLNGGAVVNDASSGGVTRSGGC